MFINAAFAMSQRHGNCLKNKLQIFFSNHCDWNFFFLQRLLQNLFWDDSCVTIIGPFLKYFISLPFILKPTYVFYCVKFLKGDLYRLL